MAWKWSKVLFLCNCTAHTALICSLAGGNKPRGSSSLNKDTTRLPHGIWKADLVQTGGQTAEWGPLGFLFISYWKIPPVTYQELHLWRFTVHMKSLTSVNSIIILSEGPSVSLSLSPTMNPLSFAHRQTAASFDLWVKEWLYCIQRTQRLYSQLSCLLLIFHSYLHLCLSLRNTSQHQPGLVSSTQWLQHQHPPPDKEADRKTERRRRQYKIQQHRVWKCRNFEFLTCIKKRYWNNKGKEKHNKKKAKSKKIYTVWCAFYDTGFAVKQ